MAGAKQYDRTELLDRAVELFRRQGFSATSTAELVDELGVNRKSMYAEFGSKQGLFEATLERYNEHHLTNVIGPIEAPDAGPDAIRAAFDGYAAASDGWAQGRGCLLCNTAVERGALDEGARRHVAAYLERLTAAFRHALDNGRSTGDVAADADLDELAAFFTMSLIGVAALIRAEAPPAEVRAACKVAVGVLDRHGPAHHA
ncbi:TetR/AcrR family transcriptional regulator [Ilumatobacter sp.]|uniref:TetR/AcrR family transcriptional regulator n=1 Tax=Ilumatobacter sp. TaxID=1967498 RepID=UPI003AF5EC82